MACTSASNSLNSEVQCHETVSSSELLVGPYNRATWLDATRADFLVRVCRERCVLLSGCLMLHGGAVVPASSLGLPH